MNGRWVATYLPIERHGTLSTYSQYSCRCPECTTAGHRETVGEVEHPRSYRPADVKKIVSDYVQLRYSIRKIAEGKGLAYATVHRILSGNNVQFRPRGGSNRKGK